MFVFQTVFLDSKQSNCNQFPGENWNRLNYVVEQMTVCLIALIFVRHFFNRFKYRLDSLQINYWESSGMFFPSIPKRDS